MNFSICANTEFPLGRLAVREEKADGVTVVWADVLAKGALDENCAAVISVDPGELEAISCVWRHSEFWCRPWFGESVNDVPDETHCLMGLRKDGSYLVILPVTGGTYKCVLQGTEAGLGAKLYSWDAHLNRCDAPAFVYAEGTDPFAMLNACARAGAKAAGGFNPMREDRVYPPIFEYLGWCSWDAMEIRVNEADLCRKADEFREKNIPVQQESLLVPST